MGQWLSERTGQQFIVESRPGGRVGAIETTLYDNLSFNFMLYIAPAAGITSIPPFVVIDPSVPARTLPEFLAYAKANPGKINMGSAGVGSGGCLFNMMAGVKLAHVPYRGNGRALAGFLGSEAEVLFAMPPSSGRSRDEGALCRSGRRADADDAGRVRQTHC